MPNSRLPAHGRSGMPFAVMRGTSGATLHEGMINWRKLASYLANKGVSHERDCRLTGAPFSSRMHPGAFLRRAVPHFTELQQPVSAAGPAEVSGLRFFRCELERVAGRRDLRGDHGATYGASVPTS